MDALEEFHKQSKPGGSSLIFINDHGGAPVSNDDPASATISLGGQIDLRTQDFGDFANLKLSDQKYVRLVGIQCFSGALHEVSFQNENTCSATSTDFSVTNLSDERISLYGQGFWYAANSATYERSPADLDENGEVSLLEAHYAGMVEDTNNEGRGQTSSMAFIDKVLKQGAYDPTNVERHGFFDFNYSKIRMNPPPTFGVIEEKEPCKLNAQSNLTDLIKVQNMVDATLNHGSLLEESAETLGPLLPFYKKMRERFQDYERQLSAGTDAYLEKDRQLRKEWEALNPLEKIFKHGEFEEKFEALRWKAVQDNIALYSFWKFAEYMRKTKEFLTKATEDQKKTFRRLVDCENAPL